MLLLLLLLLTAPPATRAQGEHRLRLTDGSNPCNGLLQVYHDGRWGYVCSSSLNVTVQEVACKSTHCGKPRGTVDALLPVGATFWMEQLKCKGSEEQLWECDFSKWSVKMEENPPLITEKLTCSHNIRVYLDFKCAGHVRYSTDGGQTAGFICGDSFGEKEAGVLCSNLRCGGVKEILNWPNSAQGSTMISTSCLGNETQLWQCAPKTEKTCKNTAYVYCQGHKDVRLKGNSSNVCSGEVEMKDQDSWRPENNQDPSHLQNWCKQMFCGNYSLGNRTLLTCSDHVRVTLLAGQTPARCYGTVHVERNGKNTPVCATQWSKTNSKLVCRELGCGTDMHWSEKPPSSRTSVLDYVTCSEADPSLWHCKSRHSLQGFSCNKNVYVICSESVDVRLSDGPSHCSGRLELFVEGQWQTARRSGFETPALAAVCRHLGCGDLLTGPSDPPRFSRGPDKFLDKTLKCDASKDLSSCSIKDNNSPNRDEKIVDITCTGHTDVFFSGGFCAGEVQVLKSSELYLLSASSLTKPVADAVCAQRRCGTASDFGPISKASLELPLWTLKNCPVNLTSVFDCQHNETETDATVNVTVNVALVNCTGSKQVNLTEQCWGFVNVCENGDCGGIRAEAWPDENSKLICESLECGKNIKPITKPNNPPHLRYSSLHLLPNQPDVHHSTAVLCKDTDGSCTGDAAYIVCMGAYEPRFDEPKDSCSGNVQLHQEGQFLSVCDDVVKKGHTTDFLCAQLGCGTFHSKIPHYGPAEKTPYVKELTCPKNSRGFNSCKSSTTNDKCSPSGLRCSDWKQVALVRGQDSCSGVLFVFSEKGRAAVSAVGWTQAETDRLCRDLNCIKNGTHQSVSTQEMIHNAQFWNGSFNCSAAKSPQSLWDCKSNDSHLPKGKHLQLHVSCSAPPVVNISGGYSGLAQIDGTEVCSSLWKLSFSHLLCRELGYKDAVPTEYTERPGSSSTQYQHVTCEPHHERVGQCQRFIGPCTDWLVSVICTDGVDFKTSETCGGDLQVRIGDGPLEKVCSTEKLPLNIQKTMCLKLGCGGTDQTGRASTKKDKMVLNFSLSCTDDHQHPRYCLSRESCSETPVQLFCEGYVPPPGPPLPPSRVLPVVLGVLLVLVLCVGALLLLRFYLRRRKKSLKELLPVFWRKKQQDFESAASEEYEDVTSPDSNRLQMLVSDVGGAADKGSTSSQNYYNVDELTQPLTSGDDPPRPSEDSDGQESYDDIDEIQTKAEVHAPPLSPEGQQRPLTPEGGEEDQPEGGGPRGGGEWEAEWEAGESPDLVLGEDDYLVPPGAEP